VLGPVGELADGGEPLAAGRAAYPIDAEPPPAARRRGLDPRLALGVRALDFFMPCCEGQQMGIFAGSGVGKSSLLSMVARATAADVLVIGLSGERGRELNAFLERTLGSEGRARSIVVAATSDMPAMLRRRAAYVTLTIAECLRDQGLRVLCLMDSVTRFAMALREIHLAAGEVPASRGYPPSVFAELPRLLERVGLGEGAGSITGLFTVLVEGDDTNEPVSDAVRGILDGHIMLERGIAEGGRFPAVDIPRSLSRSAPACYLPEERGLAREARRLMRAYAEMADLVRLGAYKAGSNPELDAAVAARPALGALLRQELDETARPEDGFAELERILARLGQAPDRVTGWAGMPWPSWHGLNGASSTVSARRARLHGGGSGRDGDSGCGPRRTLCHRARPCPEDAGRYGACRHLCCGPPRAAEAPPGRRPALGGTSTAAGAGGPRGGDQAQDA
jgi:flagellum-specific ATP synthase